MAERVRFTGIRELLTMRSRRGEASSGGGDAVEAAERAADDALGVLRDAVVDCAPDGTVERVVPRDEAPAGGVDREVDLGGAVVLPGLVDAHTHVVFGGDRTADFAARCAGLSYEEVARRGGGIRLTVGATREASHDELADGARERLRDLLGHGATTVEVKSGYGLSVEAELKQLQVTARLAEEGPWRIVPTVLAHKIPDEARDDREGHVRRMVEELLPEAASRGLARHVDVFCDQGAFDLDESRRILERGRELGLGVKIHAEQLTHLGGSRMAAELGAFSADHLEHVDDADLHAMAEAGTTAVLLPGAVIFLGRDERPPGRRIREAGVPIALATDCNPGTCPSRHLPLMVTLGCTWAGLAPEEALLGVTRHGARAVGVGDGRGTIVPGAPCDLTVCDVPGWRHIPYHFGANPVREVRVGGERVHAR